MATDPPVAAAGWFHHWITAVEVSPGSSDPDCKFSARIFVNNELVCNLPWIDYTRPLQWLGLLCCDVSPSSRIALRLCTSIKGKSRYFNFSPFTVSEVDEETGESTLELPEAAWVVTIKSLTPMTAAQEFSEQIKKLDAIENAYNGREPEETVKYNFKSVLQFAKLVAEALPGCGAKLSFCIYMKAWEALNQQIKLDDTIQEILRGLTGIRNIIDTAGQASSSMLTTALERSKQPINSILTLLVDISIWILNRYKTNDLVHVALAEETPDDENLVGMFLTRLDASKNEFYALWSTSVVSCVDSPNVVGVETSSTTRECVQTVLDEPVKIAADTYDTLNLLKAMDPHGYDPDRACLKGTREAILNQIITWTQNRDSTESFIWISGQAGMGKSSIAHSLCYRLDKFQALAGCFFCQGNNSDSSNPLQLINSIVHDIASQCPAYALEVAHAIRANRRLCTSHLSLRYEGLIKIPLERLKSLSISKTLILIVDALDECGDRDSRPKILQKLHEMSQLVPWLKIMFTSRPERSILGYFKKNCPPEAIIHLDTHDASDDIRAYIKENLGGIDQAEHWPQDSLDRLCKTAEGVFLWAALSTNYIRDSTIPALSRLRRVLDNRKSPVTDHFDTMYTGALLAAIKDYEDETQEAYTRCIGTIIATSERRSLTLPDLQHLLLVGSRIEKCTLGRIISDLGPLLAVVDGQYVRFYHSSFKDYVMDRSRSGNLFIDINKFEVEPAVCCIKVLQQDLRFNICKLESSNLLNNEVLDLKLRTHSYIGPALKYACIHWIDHFAASPNKALVSEIKKLLGGPQILYWIEALSLLGRIDVAVIGLAKLASIELNEVDDWVLIASWVVDAHRFVLSFYDAIAASAPHLYISALAFAPAGSFTARRMRPYFPNIISITRGADLDWHPCIKTICHPHAVQSLAISPDGLRAIFGHPDGSLRLLDGQTYAPVGEPLFGHTDSVTSIVFSPNGNFIASGSYDTMIRVWDTAKQIKGSHALAGHTDSIHSVAFSPDSTIIASASSDKTIRLWDPKAKCSIGGPYVGHSSRVTSVAFSPDGTKLVSGSWDKTIRVWSVDLSRPKLASDPLLITGHSDSVTCVTFSPDGTKIASGSIDKTIWMWDIQTTSVIETGTPPAKHSDAITSIAFSVDGKLLASSSLDGVVRLWNAVTLAPYSHTFGHANAVNAVAFCPDNRYIISGSTDRTARVWKLDAYPSSKPLAATTPLGYSSIVHSSMIHSVTISVDGTRIVSGTADYTVRMWDAQHGSPIGDPFVGHSGHVLCVAITPDGARIASGSSDKTMKLWDTSTQTTLRSYQHSSIIRCIAFSPDGGLIIFGSDDQTTYLWDVNGWKMIGSPLQGHSGIVVSVAPSPDGAWLASAGDRTVILWDLTTRSRFGQPFSGHRSYVRSVAFSPCSTKLVSGSDDRTVRLWDRQTGSTLLEMTGHSGLVMSVAFSPNGFQVASGSFDTTVRLWDVKTGKLIGLPFTEHSKNVRYLAFSPDGRYIISSSDDKLIRAWNLDAPCSALEQVNDPPSAFCWPASPYELSSHPHHPGWVTHDQKSLVFWLPAHHQQPDQFSSPQIRGPSTHICLDYSTFVYGVNWTAVACDSIRRSSQ
ncbi:WD40-repeat-containing domain protein [Rhizoctonia solani]|nr:WD40-repeat-containing domain protein [Rhizoctonia solani]